MLIEYALKLYNELARAIFAMLASIAAGSQKNLNRPRRGAPLSLEERTLVAVCEGGEQAVTVFCFGLGRFAPEAETKRRKVPLTNQSITETINPATAAIDSLPTSEVVALINAEDALVAGAVALVGHAIAQLADAAAERMRQGGRLIYVGAGTSGRLGVLDAAECPPTFSAPPGQVIGLIAGGPAALTRSIEAVEDDPDAGRSDVGALNVGPQDTVLGIAASGRTPYVLGAVAEARDRGALVAGLACTQPSPLAGAVDLMIAPIVGPEVIAGSTRMKAGTAQKLVLNTLSTTVMIRLGKTYGNLMVDVQPLNEKLRRRTVQIVAAATGLAPEQASLALDQAGRDPKTAIVMTLAGLDATEARRRLLACGGLVRAALAWSQ